ncbi:hypothetical protein F5884DRAFT_904877 [Xylogone sp. PMI_703]|nr:hypothetical protein F5884DRAFT_904877 [Xylogone sp. PMI_703]
MKSLLLYLALLLSTYLQIVSGYGVRGAAERTLYYIAYIAEEVSAPNGFTIAPGCLGSRPGNRCTLDEFLLYLWKEQPTAGDTTKPTGFQTKGKQTKNTGILGKAGAQSPDDLAKLSIDNIWNKVNGARFDTGKAVTGNSDASKLLPNLADADYYSALAKCSAPIALAEKTLGNAATSANKQLFKLGKNAASVVNTLRWEDMESFRLTFLKNNPALKEAGVVIQTKSTPTGLKGRSFDMIDVAGTVKKYEASVPNVAQLITDANNKWKGVTDATSGKMVNAEHLKAVAAAEVAARACGCVPVTSGHGDLRK